MNVGSSITIGVSHLAHTQGRTIFRMLIPFFPRSSKSMVLFYA
ncbi:hypothetical protein LINGRAPRIM_LOCUS3459 [Linum grandiflorum]